MSGFKIPSPAGLVRRLPFPYRAPYSPYGIELVDDRRKVGSAFPTEWARRYPSRLARLAILEGFLRPAVGTIAPKKVHGEDRLDGLSGPAIFVANHHSHLDTPLMLTSIPEPWRHRMFVGAAADYFFGNQVSGTFSALALNAIPIERNKISRASGDLAAKLINQGWSLLIFPEGGRSPDGWGQEFRGGAAYLAIRCGVPVVPVYISGTNRVLPKGQKGPKRHHTSVTFGRPLVPGERDDTRRLGARIETAVEELADEATNNWWVARQHAAAGSTPSLSGPDASTWRRKWELGEQNPKRRRSRRRWPYVK